MENIKFFQDTKHEREVIAINYTAKTIMIIEDAEYAAGISVIPSNMFHFQLNMLRFNDLEQISETWFQTIRLSALMKISRDIHSPRPALEV